MGIKSTKVTEIQSTDAEMRIEDDPAKNFITVRITQNSTTPQIASTSAKIKVRRKDVGKFIEALGGHVYPED